MAVLSMVVGAVTDSSAVFAVRAAAASTVAVVWSTDSSMSDATVTATVPVDAQGAAKVTVIGLEPDTDYWWQVEENGIRAATVGTFTTHPRLGEPADFTFAAASCAGGVLYPGTGSVLAPNRISNSLVFDSIRNQKPLWFSHMGDATYYDPGSGVHVPDASLATYRRMYEDMLTQPRQAHLYRSVPLQYTWDDHDYGPNNGDRTSPGRVNAQTAYRERWPHYAMDSSGGIYQSWTVGRVLFIASDVRSDRDPNSTVDSGAKTMLGEAQKAWMRGILSTSDARFFVWITPSVWMHPNGEDTWAVFESERDEMINMFAQTGWSHRMMVMWGDRHANGLSTGAGVPGGYPSAQFAAMDSEPSAPHATRFDVGPESAEFGQYGTVRINDEFTRITVTMTSWIMDAEYQSYTFSVETGDVVPEPPADVIPVPPPARIQTEVTWLAHDARTGKIIEELPEVTGTTGRLLGAYTSAGLKVAAPLHGPAALGDRLWTATNPGRTIISQIVNGRPAWAGLVVARVSGSQDYTDLATVTCEGYWARRRVRDHDFQGVDQALIAETLMRDAFAIDGVGAGLPILIDAPSSGVSRDREYLATDRKTIYAALRELMAVEGGPEWTIDPEWSDSTETHLMLVARVRNRIGTASTSGVTPMIQNSPAVLYDGQGGSEPRYTLNEDYTDSRGANWIVAYSSGEGEDQPASNPAYSAWAITEGGWVIFEDHFQPSTSISSEATLDEHARARLSRMAYGAHTVKITARWDAEPRINTDWRIGDDMKWRLYGHRHPNGWESQGRVLGYEVDAAASVISPTLWEPSEDPL